MTVRRGLGVLIVVLLAVLCQSLPARGAGWESENVDGNGGSGGQVEGDMLGGTRASVWFGGELHTFYFDSTGGNLRHAVNSGGVWHYQTLDGEGGPNGRVDSWTGGDPTAVMYGGLPYVFYRDEDAGTLRMATFGGDDWYFATLDGEGGPNGREDTADTGFEPSALVFGGLPYVFYWGKTDAGRALRMATWGGNDWYFGTLDGDGGPNGRIAASVGTHPSAIVFGGLPYVFYGDETNSDIRMATWGGTDWYYAALDGAGGPNGRVADGFLNGPSAVVTGGLPYVFYNATTGIRMATWGGTDWFFGPVPVDAGPNRAAHPDPIDGLSAPAFVYEEDTYAAGLGLAWWSP